MIAIIFSLLFSSTVYRVDSASLANSLRPGTTIEVDRDSVSSHVDTIPRSVPFALVLTRSSNAVSANVSVPLPSIRLFHVGISGDVSYGLQSDSGFVLATSSGFVAEHSSALTSATDIVYAQTTTQTTTSTVYAYQAFSTGLSLTINLLRVVRDTAIISISYQYSVATGTASPPPTNQVSSSMQAVVPLGSDLVISGLRVQEYSRTWRLFGYSRVRRDYEATLRLRLGK